MEFLVANALRLAKLAYNLANDNAAAIGNILAQLRTIQGGSTNVGTDGSSAVFKNGNFYLMDQSGLYHLASCYVVDGQAQMSISNTAYAYNSIP